MTTPSAARQATAGLLLALMLLTSPAQAVAGARVWVDAGHGGNQPGATAGGYLEKNINLPVSLMLAEELAARGVLVGQSRTGDMRVELADRSARANAFGADLFVSIHCNLYPYSTAPYGTEVFYQFPEIATSARSKVLADSLLDNLETVYGTSARTNKQGDFSVLWNTDMPAALVELGFMSNYWDLLELVSPVLQRQAAVAMADALVANVGTFHVDKTRIGGDTLYDTAALIAQTGWPTGAGSVILASGETWSDALTASSLSGKLDAPILLTASKTLPPATAAAISRLRPSQIIVIGGNSAISDSVLEQAVAVARVAAGFPLAAPSAREATVSVESTPSLEASASVEASTSVETSSSREATGGPTESSAPAALAGPNARRIGGATLYDTAYLVAAECGVPTQGAGAGTVLVVSGEHYADGVSASAMAASLDIPLLLSPAAQLGSPAARFLVENDAAIRSIELVGGDCALSPSVAAAASIRGTLTRNWGVTQYDTSLALAKRSQTLLQRFDGAAHPLRSIVLATGGHYADALAAGAFAAKTGDSSLLITHEPSLAQGTAVWLEPFVASSRFQKVYVMGGSAAISESFSRSLDYSVGKGPL